MEERKKVWADRVSAGCVIIGDHPDVINLKTKLVNVVEADGCKVIFFEISKKPLYIKKAADGGF